jgi:UDP-N-acetyl-D-mannosaminuronate dehydrogenase
VPIALRLEQLGADVSYHDPLVARWALEGSFMTSVPDLEAAIKSADLVVLLQSHRAYQPDELAAASRAFLDTRGVTTSDASQRL